MTKKTEPLPEWAIDAGHGWVEVRDVDSSEWFSAILIAKIPTKCLRYIAITIEGEVCRWEQMREIEQPEKIPYTAETFFESGAIWMKHPNDDIYSVVGIHHTFIEIKNAQISYDTNTKYEIAGIDGVWQPFYQLKKS